MKRFFNTMAAAAFALAALLSVACSDDKENLTVQNVAGEYAGTFDFTPSASDINPDPAPQNGIAVSFRVEDGQVFFPEFPAAALVTALLGEEGAASLIPMLGTITYQVPMSLSSANDSSLSATLTTPQLRIDIGGALIVLITIEAPEQLVYTKNGTLSFTLKTTLCQLGEGEAAGAPFPLVNELEFSAKKQ